MLLSKKKKKANYFPWPLALAAGLALKKINILLYLESEWFVGEIFPVILSNFEEITRTLHSALDRKEFKFF